MLRLMRKFEDYLYEALGLPVRTEPWTDVTDLPIYIQDSYRLYRISIHGESFLVVVAIDGDGENTPASIRKHLEHIEKRTGLRCIYVQPTITAYNRRRLIEQRVPFIVPGNQMYLPDLSIDLREYFRKPHKRQTAFSPATQIVIIYRLLNEPVELWTPTLLAKNLNYSIMTMSRALDELEASEVAHIHYQGKMRYVEFQGSSRDLWNRCLPLLRSPVRRRLRTSDRVLSSSRPIFKAGLSALAECTMLNAPTYSVFAVDSRVWRRIKDEIADASPSSYGEECEVEIWRYDPRLLAEGNFVDPFSLYLSLSNDTDERVEGALKELMEKWNW